MTKYLLNYGHFLELVFYFLNNIAQLHNCAINIALFTQFLCISLLLDPWVDISIVI